MPGQGRGVRAHLALATVVVALGAIAIEPALPDYDEADAVASSGAHYVSPSGNDRDDGSLAHPWRTLQFAFDRLKSGDTLFVRGGTYFEHPTASIHGAPTAPIVIRSYPG